MFLSFAATFSCIARVIALAPAKKAAKSMRSASIHICLNSDVFISLLSVKLMNAIAPVISAATMDAIAATFPIGISDCIVHPFFSTAPRQPQRTSRTSLVDLPRIAAPQVPHAHTAPPSIGFFSPPSAVVHASECQPPYATLQTYGADRASENVRFLLSSKHCTMPLFSPGKSAFPLT